MRFYGTVKTNLFEIFDKHGIANHYSVDSLMLESKDGMRFDIDFCEGDWGKGEGILYFRMKSLGCTFIDTWEQFDIDSVNAMENNYELLNDSIPKTIVMFLSCDDEINDDILEEIYFKVVEANMLIGSKTIEYDVSDIVVEAY